MESQNELIQKVRICMSRNISKLAIAMFLIGIITLFIVSVLIFPMAVAILLGDLNAVLLVGFALFSIVIITIIYILVYGYFVLALLLYRKQQAGLGNLFVGFRNFKQAFLVGLVFTIISVIVMFIFASVLGGGMASILTVRGELIDYRDNMVFVMSCLLGIVLIVLVAMYLRYGFVWFIMYDQPELTVRTALKQSALLTKGKCLKLLLFCIKSAGFFFLASLLAFIVMQVLPPSSDTSQISLVLYISSSLVNITYLLCAFMSVIRICIAFTAWYTAYYAPCTASNDTDSTV